MQHHVQNQPMQTRVQNQPVQTHVQNQQIQTHIHNQPVPSHVQNHPGFNPPAPVQAQHVQAQVLPNGQTIYVNAPPPQYGYATVQYHPNGQQTIIHQQVPGAMPPHGGEQQQYISVVPIQSHGGAVQGMGPGGTYAYLQPDGQYGMPQTVTIVQNPQGPGGVPVAVARVGNKTPAESPRRQQSNSQGGRGKEKFGGKGRRGGRGVDGSGSSERQSQSSRRSGGGNESKPQSSASGSPLLEEFKAKKNRDWKIFEIKGMLTGKIPNAFPPCSNSRLSLFF